jgi:hypothetical protein
MTGKNERSDSRLNAARYQVDRLLPGDNGATDRGAGAGEADDDSNTAGQVTMEQTAQYVEISIQQAMRRGEFDNLPGSGRPLKNLEQAYHPDWWIRQKIERERLTGLGPPALTLRTEDRRLDETLDAAPSEAAVRETLDDFNTRIVAARRQLQGGPPVVTPLRDVEEELARWKQRRAGRLAAAEEARRRSDAELAAMTRAERRRARRER